MRCLKGLLPLALLLGVAACEPTGVPRCDEVLAALVYADQVGYRFDCDPPAEFEPHLGWTDHDTKTLYVWEGRISDNRVLAKVMFHEVGHAVVEVRGLTFSTQSAEEVWADGYSWCRFPQSGVSYLSKPTNCDPYLKGT